MEFKDRLKELRISNNMLQRDLAKKLSYGESTISNYENGHNTPSYQDLKTIASIFNVSLDYILCVTDIKTPYGGNHEYSEKTMSLIKQLISFDDEQLDEVSQYVKWISFRDDVEGNTKSSKPKTKVQLVAQTGEAYKTKQ